ncbi:hypothetical protein [Olsenella phocaeensis]|uniref:hypothetical protein n=1 Tax=Olsenella phocaeensis TaxID=1852385 RepID=UPI003A8D16D6
MNNSLGRLNEVLFEELARLGDPSLSGEELRAEIERSRAVGKIAQAVTANANTILRTAEIRAEYGAGAARLPELLGGQ